MQKSAEAFHRQEDKDKARAIAEMINGKRVTLKLRAGDNGNLFGAVTNKDIAEKIREIFDIDVNKHSIVLDTNIKECGEYEIKVKLYPEVTAKVTVEVLPE